MINIKTKQLEKSFFYTGLIITIIFAYSYRSNFFWDLNVYQDAVNVFNQGGSAYKEFEQVTPDERGPVGLRFVYSPYVLIFFSCFGQYLTPILILLYIASTLYLISKKLGRQVLYFSIISSAFVLNEFFVKSIASGNLTIFLHFILLAIAANPVKNRINVFLATTCLASLIKPYFSAYFFLIYVLWNEDSVYIKRTLIAFTIFVIFFISQILVYPELFSDFIYSLSEQALGNLPGRGRDVGLAPYAIFGHFVARPIALMLHFAILAIGILITFRIIYRIRGKIDNHNYQKILFYAALIFVVLLNPRMKVYDYWLLVGSSTAIIFIIMNLQTIILQTRSSYFIAGTAIFLAMARFIDLKYFNVISVYLFPLFAFILIVKISVSKEKSV